MKKLERRPVPDWPYEVDEEGQIYRTGKSNSTWVGRQVTQRVNPRDGYLECHLSKPEQRNKSFKVHVVVCMAWHGPRPPGQQVRHLDGDKYNNRGDNLAWGTYEENLADAIKHGSYLRGEDHPTTVYPDSVVATMRKEHAAHLKLRHAEGHKWARRGFINELAKRFGMSHGYASQLLHRKGIR